MITRQTQLHIAELCQDNAQWNLDKYNEEADRFHLGQFKAYQRIAKRLIELEQDYDSKEELE